MAKCMLVNVSKTQYVLPEDFGEDADIHSVMASQNGILLALAVLCADGNNRGGGDLRSDAPVIGSWAGDQIAIIDENLVVPEFSSAPGLEETPLYEQMLKVGKNVADLVVAAVLEGDGADGELGRLDRSFPAPLTVQRQRLSRQITNPTLRNEYRFTSVADFFAVFRLPVCESAKAFGIALEQKLCELGEILGSRYRIAVLETPFLELRKLRDSCGFDKTQGSIRLEVSRSQPDSGLEPVTQRVVIHLRDGTGTPLATLMEHFFPDVPLNDVQKRRAVVHNGDAFQRLLAAANAGHLVDLEGDA